MLRVLISQGRVVLPRQMLHNIWLLSQSCGKERRETSSPIHVEIGRPFPLTIKGREKAHISTRQSNDHVDDRGELRG